MTDRDFRKLKRTTVADLKKMLAELPDDALVFLDGYERGYDDVTNILSVAVALNQNHKSYEGAHDDVHDSSEGAQIVEGFVISRGSW